MHRLQPVAFTFALLLFLPGVFTVIAGALEIRTEQILPGVLDVSVGTLFLTYGARLALRAARQRFPGWIGDLHAMFHI